MTESEYQKHICEKADAVQTKEDLSALLDEITSYNHAYGTVIWGCFAAMVGAFNVVNRSPKGGITGFQAGCLAHELLQKFSDLKPPYRILNYNDMLYPQYEYKFEKFVSIETWKHLQSEAKKLLGSFKGHPAVKNHLERIADGQMPFGYRIGEP